MNVQSLHACAYFTYREKFTIIDGLLAKDNRIVIPTNMHHDCLETLHASHLGVNKTLMQAHTSVFWPGMTADITALVSNCPTCQKFQSKQPPESLRNELPTTQPWASLATDIFELNGKSYLIVVGHYNNSIIHLMYRPFFIHLFCLVCLHVFIQNSGLLCLRTLHPCTVYCNLCLFGFFVH